jgi:hypothetical protein
MRKVESHGGAAHRGFPVRSVVEHDIAGVRSEIRAENAAQFRSPDDVSPPVARKSEALGARALVARKQGKEFGGSGVIDIEPGSPAGDFVREQRQICVRRV